VALPFVKKTDLETYELANPGVLTYLSSNVNAAGKYVGSALSSGTLAALTAASIQTIFELSGEDAIDALTASGITTGLSAATIPADKTLTLIGTTNAFAAALDLSSAGNLVVKGTLTASGSVAITGNATTANITITPEGTLALGTSGSIAGKIENNGTITSAVTTGPEQGAIISLAGLSGSGKIVLSGTGTTAAGTATLALAQDVEISGKLIAPGHATPFSGTKTITVTSAGTLDLGAIAVTSIGVTIVNGGTVSTATTTTAALNTILAIGGTITSAGDVAGTDNITVPAGTIFTHDTGTFGGGTGTLTINGTATFTKGIFGDQTGKLTVNGTATFAEATFAKLTSLEVGGRATFTAATFAALTTLEVGGTLTAGAATLVAVTSLTVNGTLTARAATFGALTTAGVTGTGSVTAGVVSGETATPQAQALIGSNLESVSLATTTLNGALTIPVGTTRTFTGAFAPAGAVTVNGIAVIENGLTLVEALTLGTDGALELAASKAVTLGDGAAKITGTTYEITAVASSSDGTLTAGASLGAVVFTASKISGMAGKVSLAAATLVFGTNDSVLTVKGDTVLEAVTLDVATKGKISVNANQKLTLKYVADDNGVLSGGIFTVAVSGGTAGGAVKANAATPQTTNGAIADAAALAAAKVEAALTAGAVGDLGTGNGGSGTDALDLEDGVITDSSAVTIDKADTFAVKADGAITVTTA
jgi:hypothetical protein